MADTKAGIELECEDLDAALADKSVAVRSAACRDLSKVGQPARLEQLIEMAGQDKSPAVRLGTASAAADILSRHRWGPARAAIDEDRRARLLRALNRVDPSVNAGLFPMLACLDVPASLGRIRIGLRDPRRGVRIGAAVGLLRHVASVSKVGDADIAELLVSSLSDKRLPADSIAEVARVCAAIGLHEALPRLETIDLGGTLQELVDAALAALRQAEARPLGLWVGDGLDAGETNPTAAAPAVLVVGPAGAWSRAPGGDWQPVAGPVQRRIWLRRPGTQEPVHGLQIADTTWYAPVDSQLEEALDLPALAVPAAPVLGAGLDAVLATLDETPAGLRLRAVAALALGAPDAALAALDLALAEKKPAPDLRTLRARAVEARDGAAAATPAWEEALKKARPKSAWYGKRAKDALAR